MKIECTVEELKELMKEEHSEDKFEWSKDTFLKHLCREKEPVTINGENK